MQEVGVVIRNGKFTTSMQRGGSGEPLLFLHGAGGPLVGAPFLEELAQNFTIYAPAHPDLGSGTGIEHIDDVIDIVLYYHDSLDELQINRPHIVGHSLGGMVAAETSALAPYRINRLVLICPAGLWLDDNPIPDVFTFNPRQMVEYVFHDPSGLMSQMFTEQLQSSEAQLEMYKCLASNGKFLWPILDKGFKKCIRRLQLPTLLLLWEASDRLDSVGLRGSVSTRHSRLASGPFRELGYTDYTGGPGGFCRRGIRTCYWNNTNGR